MPDLKSQLEALVPPRFLSDERYRQWHINVMAVHEGTTVLGVHTPDIKQLARQLVKDGSWREVVEDLSHRMRQSTLAYKPAALIHEERLVWGLILDYIKVPLDERFPLIDQFVPCVDNWCICDNFCCNSNWGKRADRDQFWLHLEPYFSASEPFAQRLAIVLAQCHFLDDSTINRTFARIEQMRIPADANYYLQMAVAWTLATALRKNRQATYDYLRQSTLPDDIRKIYARKVRESRFTHEVPPFAN